MNQPLRLPPIPLFSGISRDALAALVGGLELRRVKAGATIVREGEVGAEMFILVRGSARVLREIDGRRRQVDEIRERAFFGEIALLADVTRLATVEAATDAELLVLPRATLEALMRAHPSIDASVRGFVERRVLANVLRANPVLRSLSERGRQAIAAGMQIGSAPRGARLLDQGTRARALRLVLRGGCEVFHAAADGSEIRYPELGEGGMFGEISLMLGTETTATVRAASRCVFVTLSREAFEHVMRSDGALREHLEALRDQRIQNTAAELNARDLPMDAELLLCA